MTLLVHSLASIRLLHIHRIISLGPQFILRSALSADIDKLQTRATLSTAFSIPDASLVFPPPSIETLKGREGINKAAGSRVVEKAAEEVLGAELRVGGNGTAEAKGVVEVHLIPTVRLFSPSLSTTPCPPIPSPHCISPLPHFFSPYPSRPSRTTSKERTNEHRS